MSRDRYRCSFDAVAEVYERARPGYAPEALAWIAQRLRLARVLDLGAGTGKLTRQLVAAGADVVAVEPGDEMRAILTRVVPGARALAGAAEAIPLPDASVDAVVVGQAFHWFETEHALAEMHRVLSPNGGIGLLWNHWDDGDALLHELNELIERLRPGGGLEGPPQWRVALDESPLFGDVEERNFAHAELLPADQVVDRVSSTSALAAAEPEAREQALADVREVVGVGEVPFPLITTVLVADRA